MGYQIESGYELTCPHGCHYYESDGGCECEKCLDDDENERERIKKEKDEPE